jgi:3',5'-cyclic AMP phosphodiesterase CpdA
MRTLVHLSDLHFGRIDEAIIGPLTEFVHRIAPDVVVVSGDLTQRARSRQFMEARRFLDSLPKPQVVVPGNHDVPLHNLFSRFRRPLSKYIEYISSDLSPFYIDEEIAVIGINTARALTLKNGWMDEAQIEMVRQRLCPLDEKTIKIVVTHHPFDLPEQYEEEELARSASTAMNTFSACRVDVLLAGHIHVSHAGSTAMRYKVGGYASLFIQAGTATSTRGRGEANSFNVIRTTPSRITVERLCWEPEARTFISAASQEFQGGPAGWKKEESAAT